MSRSVLQRTRMRRFWVVLQAPATIDHQSKAYATVRALAASDFTHLRCIHRVGLRIKHGIRRVCNENVQVCQVHKMGTQLVEVN